MERKREQVLALLFLDDLELFIFLQSEWIILGGYQSPPDRFSKPTHVRFEVRHYNQLR